MPGDDSPPDDDSIDTPEPTAHDLRIAELTAMRHAYPDVFPDLRDNWVTFIEDPGSDSEAYVDMLNAQVLLVEDADVRPDDRTDVVVSAFWAASADVVINRRPAEKIDEMRKALEKIW